MELLNTLYEIIVSRKTADPETSYVAKLFKKGTPKIAQKVGEEAVETVIAATAQGKKELISESADLLFHLLILWANKGVKPLEVEEELSSRFGHSGLDEKKNRTTTK